MRSRRRGPSMAIDAERQPLNPDPNTIDTPAEGAALEPLDAEAEAISVFNGSFKKARARARGLAAMSKV